MSQSGATDENATLDAAAMVQQTPTMPQPTIDWMEHAYLYVLNASGLDLVAAGSLATLVEAALHFEDGFACAVIETDRKAMYCRAEVATLARDTTRPKVARKGRP